MDDLLLGLRVAVSLAAVLGALWFLQRRLTKGAGAAGRTRRGLGRRGEGIQVVSRQGIGPKAQLVVVDVEGTRYVLGVTEQGVSVIDRARAQAPDEGSGSDLVASFEKLLAEAATQPAPLPPAAVSDAPEGDASEAAADETDPPAPLRRRDRRAAQASPAADPLAGSILSPATWRHTAQALGLRR